MNLLVSMINYKPNGIPETRETFQDHQPPHTTESTRDSLQQSYMVCRAHWGTEPRMIAEPAVRY